MPRHVNTFILGVGSSSYLSKPGCGRRTLVKCMQNLRIGYYSVDCRAPGHSFSAKPISNCYGAQQCLRPHFRISRDIGLPQQCWTVILPPSSASYAKRCYMVRFQGHSMLTFYKTDYNNVAGVNVILFGVALLYLIWLRKTRDLNIPMLIATCGLFSMCTTHFTLEFSNILHVLVSSHRKA